MKLLINGKNYILLATGLIIGMMVAAVVVTRYPLPTRIASLVSIKPSPISGAIPVASPIVSPSHQPSEKSLKVAAFAWARVSDSQKKELKQRYKAEDKTDTQFLSIWALDMDNDPALYAKNEAIMEQTLTNEGRPVVNVAPPNVNVQSPRTKTSCITSNVGYSVYTTCN